MEITVRYTKEDGFQLKVPDQGDLHGDKYFPMLNAMVGYAMLVISMMRGDCNRMSTKMMLEYAMNTTRQMFEDEVVFNAVKDGIRANERSGDAP